MTDKDTQFLRMHTLSKLINLLMDAPLRNRIELHDLAELRSKANLRFKKITLEQHNAHLKRIEEIENENK